jgi:hypothetical protein
MPGFKVDVLLHALAVWLLLMAAESAHGAVRRLLGGPDGPFFLRQVSGLIGAVITSP